MFKVTNKNMRTMKYRRSRGLLQSIKEAHLKHFVMIICAIEDKKFKGKKSSSVNNFELILLHF